MKETSFAALLCSRLCHDLVSPVGAVSNGVEIMKEEKDPDMLVEVVDLVEQSARQTSNKIQFFRLAFGAGGGFGATIDLKEAHKCLSNFLSGINVDLDWTLEPKLVQKDYVKVLLNLALITGESLIRGGTQKVTLDYSNNGDALAAMTVSVSGKRVILLEAMKDALLGVSSFEQIEPKTAPAYFVTSLLEDLSGQITIGEQSDDSLVLQVHFA